MNTSVPPGYRFLIQLPDAGSIDAARQTLTAMFGQRVAELTVVRVGHNRAVYHKPSEYHFEWTPNVGYRCFLPLGVKLDCPRRRR